MAVLAEDLMLMEHHDPAFICPSEDMVFDMVITGMHHELRGLQLLLQAVQLLVRAAQLLDVEVSFLSAKAFTTVEKLGNSDDLYPAQTRCAGLRYRMGRPH